MTKYYIHISDEKPTNFAKGISFEVDSESNTEDKLYVVNKHEHEEMIEEWDNVKNEYLRKVTNDVISILSDTNVQHSEDAYKIAQMGDSTKYYTYPQLKQLLDGLTENKADTSRVSQIETDLGTKATTNKVNIVEKKVDDLSSDLNWQRIPNFEDTATYKGTTGTVKGYYNKHFVVIIIDKFPKTISTTGQYSNLTDVTIPDGYQPISLLQHSGGEYYNSQIAITTNGTLRVRHTKLETIRITTQIIYPRIS